MSKGITAARVRALGTEMEGDVGKQRDIGAYRGLVGTKWQMKNER